MHLCKAQALKLRPAAQLSPTHTQESEQAATEYYAQWDGPCDEKAAGAHPYEVCRLARPQARHEPQQGRAPRPVDAVVEGRPHLRHRRQQQLLQAPPALRPRQRFLQRAATAI